MLVSVVMPSYNHLSYVEEAANSVLSQTFKNIELIIIDDGSQDASVERLRGIRDSRVRLITQDNQGAHAAINRGLSLADGDYLCIINSDDVFSHDRIAKCLTFLDSENADLVCSWIRVIDVLGKVLGIKRGWENMRPSWSNGNAVNGFWEKNDFALNLLSSNFVSTTSNLFFRRKVYEEIGGMRNLRFAHDWDFLLRVAARHPCYLIEEALMDYRIHDSNTIRTNRSWMLFETCWTLAVNLPHFEGSVLFAEHGDENQRARLIREAANSIHIQGCDKTFWVLRSYLNSRIKQSGEVGELELLEAPELRQIFIDMIDEAIANQRSGSDLR